MDLTVEIKESKIYLSWIDIKADYYKLFMKKDDLFYECATVCGQNSLRLSLLPYGNHECFLQAFKNGRLIAETDCHQFLFDEVDVEVIHESDKEVKFVYSKYDKADGYRLYKDERGVGFNGCKNSDTDFIKIEKGEEKSNLYHDSVKLASICVSLDKHIPYFIAKHKVKKSIKNKTALNKLKIMISCQGGSLDLFNEEYKTPTLIIKSNKKGKVVSFNTKEIGNIVAKMGTVKMEENDKIIYENGIRTFHKIGDKVKINEPIFYIYASSTQMAEEVGNKLKKCIEIK